MTDTTLLGPWVRRFLLEHLITERNLSRNTQRSYRDTLSLLMPFAAAVKKKDVDQLAATDLDADLVRNFLLHLEEQRKCGIATRNQRLAAIHALARFIGISCPELIAWSGQIRSIPFKKSPQTQITYLEKAEMDALLNAPNRETAQGRRDHALLLFLYNSGARADEAAQLKITDLQLAHDTQRHVSSVLLHGKGDKKRRCPLWPQTAEVILPLISGREGNVHVFLNRRGQPITRFGIHTMVERYAQQVSRDIPSLEAKRVSPHIIRHTTATHLLRAGVDINTIRAWLGHVSIDTTNVYAEVDLEMKAKALAHCEVTPAKPSTKRWRDDKGVMDFLHSL
jgi:site-specific recombinase XerD